MREIKFRAWDNLNKEMYTSFDLMLDKWKDKLDYVVRMDDFAEQHIKNITLMQFTGLKDKNGKEIYEGDIVSTENDKLMVVSWSNKFASFCIRRDGWAFQHWFGEACNPEDCQVMGNIYENADLLNNSEKPAKAPF